MTCNCAKSVSAACLPDDSSINRCLATCVSVETIVISSSAAFILLVVAAIVVAFLVIRARRRKFRVRGWMRPIVFGSCFLFVPTSSWCDLQNTMAHTGNDSRKAVRNNGGERRHFTGCENCSGLVNCANTCRRTGNGICFNVVSLNMLITCSSCKHS